MLNESTMDEPASLPEELTGSRESLHWLHRSESCRGGWWPLTGESRWTDVPCPRGYCFWVTSKDFPSIAWSRRSLKSPDSPLPSSLPPFLLPFEMSPLRKANQRAEKCLLRSKGQQGGKKKDKKETHKKEVNPEDNLKAEGETRVGKSLGQTRIAGEGQKIESHRTVSFRHCSTNTVQRRSHVLKKTQSCFSSWKVAEILLSWVQLSSCLVLVDFFQTGYILLFKRGSLGKTARCGGGFTAELPEPGAWSPQRTPRFSPQSPAWQFYYLCALILGSHWRK